MTTQVDFADAGDLKVFVDAEQLKSLERKMSETGGFLDGAHMANAFNMLRPDDLIWSFFVNNYLKGKEPMPFDLLVWNANSTRMPAANHRFYLRHCYLENDLAKGQLTIDGRRIDLSSVTIPIYELATREDHIAPARSVFAGAKLFGGAVRFVLAGSGHIAGVVNPPGKPKYQHWTGGETRGAFEDWLAAAKETAGLLVAGLARLAHRAGAEQGRAARAGRGQARPARRRAGRIRAGALLRLRRRRPRQAADNQSFAGSNARLGVVFDAIFTAEDIGSYKPNPRNFEAMLVKLNRRGIAKGDILHTAESLFHDHMPARAAGLANCWIYRRHGKTGFGATMNPAATPECDFRFNGMAELVKAHQEEMRRSS